VEPVDIILLAHNRLEYLVATVEALRARTPEPFRLTIVDNASGPNVRNWLDRHSALFEQVILRPINEHVPAFQHGIDATTSDPFVVSDPDLVVPEQSPSWLAGLRMLMDRHPDFGLIGLSVEPPPGVPGPVQAVGPPKLVDGEIAEANVGTTFQMIRRDALREPYVKDGAACNAVRAAGYRVGRAMKIRALHLGAEDFRRFPGHLAEKNQLVTRWVHEGALSPYPFYLRAEPLLGRPPTFCELARAAPIVTATRQAGIPDASIVEVTWTGEPLLGAAIDGPIAIGGDSLQGRALGENAAAAVVIIDPPSPQLRAALDEAFRVAAALVVLECGLETVNGRSAPQLRSAGWSGTERFAAGRVPLALAGAGDRLALEGHDRFATLEEREHWLEFFARGAFGAGPRRLFVFTADNPAPVPLAVEITEPFASLKAAPRPPSVVPMRATLRERIRTRLSRRM
jgi:hypothetical protein